MSRVCITATGVGGSLVFTDDVSADGGRRMNSETHRVIFSAQIQPTATKLI